MKFFEKYQLKIGDAKDTCFNNANGVYQDGTTPMYRDVDGTLWAISGHSHCGEIAMFKGTCLDDMVKVWKIETNFSIGHADYAYCGIKYPEGIKPRGSIWPFGLYVCPKTHRFFCWFHNETGWNGRGTAYDAYGLCETPKFDSDFRHIGLMHSDDEGKTWVFDRWVLTANEVAFTKMYNPASDVMIGQDEGVISLGSGDFCMYIEPDGDYIYIFYDIIRLYINQIGITIFSLILYFSVTKIGNDELSFKLQIGISVFAMLFFFALLYTLGWDLGANDIIRVESGRQEKTPLKGAALALLANAVNFIFALVCIISMILVINGNEGAAGVNQVFNILLRFTNAMYLGVIKGFLSSVSDTYYLYLYQSIAYFVAPLLAVGATQLGYFLGTKNLKLFAKNKKA